MTVKVLVVEDDAITRFMMTEMCGELGYDCETVIGGQECIDLLEADPSPFDIILMDIHMPRVSGLDASQSIRNAPTDPPKNLPIVAVTADEHWHDPHRCKSAGFNGVVPKPVTFATLRRAVEEIVL